MTETKDKGLILQGLLIECEGKMHYVVLNQNAILELSEPNKNPYMESRLSLLAPDISKQCPNVDPDGIAMITYNDSKAILKRIVETVCVEEEDETCSN